MKLANMQNLKFYGNSLGGASPPTAIIKINQKGVGYIGIEQVDFVEEWKPLIYKDLDLSDRFLISNTGKLYSKVSNKILKTQINKEGYEDICVSLGGRNKKKAIKIHIAVACMFVKGYEEGLTVNHKDGNKINNNSNNLEWITYKDNTHHAYATGLAKGHGERMIKQIDIDTGEEIAIFNSIKEAQLFIKGKMTNNISNAVHGYNKTAYGYKWEFVDNK